MLPAAVRLRRHWGPGTKLIVEETSAGVLLRADAVGELESVILLGELVTRDGVIPLGQAGTIVHRYAHGEAFEVEFAAPFHFVATLRPNEITRLDG